MLFPKARFIHMVRHPYDVVPSTLNMWKIVLHQNTLNGNGSDPCIDDVIKGIDKVLATIQQDSAFLPKERYYEMKFEDLEADPVNELKKLYSYFTMPLEESLGRDLESFLNRHKCYKKNEFQLTKEEKELIQRQLFPYMRIYNYK